VLFVLAIVVLPLFILAIYAIHQIKPGWFRIHGSVLRAITFSMEIGRPGDKSGESHSEIESRHDG